jgi:Delta6-protoilludene synthase
VTLFFILDEYTDVEDELVTRQLADILMDELRNLEKARPQGECPLGEMARQWMF